MKHMEQKRTFFPQHVQKMRDVEFVPSRGIFSRLLPVISHKLKDRAFEQIRLLHA